MPLSAPQGELDVLNAGDNVVVMVDEAHRTQYGLLGARMSKALPNATLIGFTGTPIDRGFKRSTMQRFGTLIDAYTIPPGGGGWGDRAHPLRAAAA